MRSSALTAISANIDIDAAWSAALVAAVGSDFLSEAAGAGTSTRTIGGGGAGGAAAGAVVPAASAANAVTNIDILPLSAPILPCRGGLGNA